MKPVMMYYRLKDSFSGRKPGEPKPSWDYLLWTEKSSAMTDGQTYDGIHTYRQLGVYEIVLQEVDLPD